MVAITLVARGREGAPTLYGKGCTSASRSPPAVGQAFERGLAGRARSAYNLAVFAGIFALQWGIGSAIDPFRGMGFSTLSAYRGAFALSAGPGTMPSLWFLWREDRSSTACKTVSP